MSPNPRLAEKVEAFQNLLISYATGVSVSDEEYGSARTELMQALPERLPRFVRTNRHVKQLWPHFKKVSPSYQGRREYIWKEFAPLLEELEGIHTAPGDEAVATALLVLTSSSVHSSWETALERRSSDPDGAITAARTLLETVCKHILDDCGVAYSPGTDLPKLYGFAAKALNIAPTQHAEDIVKRILGGCFSVVEGIGALRNELGDAHGKGRTEVSPEPRHAELAVNLAGAVATFLVQSWETRR
jgi:hypothetical protein